MRILHVIHGFAAEYGGPPAVVTALATAQAQCGDQVVVLSTRRVNLPLVMELGDYGNLAIRDLPITHEAKWYDRTMVGGIAEFAGSADIVHVHGGWRFHLRAAAKAARAVGIPYVISPHGNLDEHCFNHKKYFKWPYFMFLERQVMNRAAGIHCCSGKEFIEVSRQPIM
jgi:glycosyltransferase involved in cell wall biosynthesis